MAAAAILKNQKNPQISISTKFGTVTVPTVKNLKFIKFNMETAAIFKNFKKCDISATVWPIAIKFGMVTQFDTHNASDR